MNLKAANAVIHAERITRRCVPDLEGLQLYLLQPEENGIFEGQEFGPTSPGCYPNRQRDIQEKLQAAGKWDGAGPAIVLNVDALTRECDETDAVRAVAGPLLHECAHWLDASPEPEPAAPSKPPPPKPTTTKQPATEPPAIPRAFWFHQKTFQRLCAHLWYRANHIGGCIMRPTCLVFGSDYRGLELLSSPGAYIDALDAELAALQRLPLREVAALEPPNEFSELWKHDDDAIWDAAAVKHAAAKAAI